MYILHLSTAHSWRGGEQQVAYLIAELARQGIQQQVICPNGSVLEAHCRQAGVAVEGFKKTFNLDLRFAHRLRNFCKENNVTHLHAHDSLAHTFAVLAAAFFSLRKPVIVHRRVDFPIGKNMLSKWKYNHPVVSRIVCVSDFIRKVAAPALRQPEKLAVVHSGIDLGRFATTDNSLKTNRLRSEYKIPNNHILVANIAAIAPHKDYFTFVNTAEKLVKNGFPATFLAIGGDGGEEKDILHLIHSKNLHDRVLLTGFRNDIAEVLPEIDLLLFTSKTEGLGTSLLDAFAAGVPVVATAAGGVSELVEHGKTGLLCKVGDAPALAKAVQQLVNDPVLQRKLAENAKAKVQHFTKEKMAEAILKIYRETGN